MGNSEKATVTIHMSKYDDLIAKERELQLIKEALKHTQISLDIYKIKEIFGIGEEQRGL